MSSRASRLPTRSNSVLKGRPPADAVAPDDQAVEDVYKQVESTGSLELAAKKLQQIALANSSASDGTGTPGRRSSTRSRTASRTTSLRGSQTGSPDRANGSISPIAPMTVAVPSKPAASRPIWADDPEEAEYMDQGGYDDSAVTDEDEYEGMDEDEVEEVVHMQEVVEGLWVGDLVGAMDQDGLEEKGIRNIVSLLRPRLNFAPSFSVFPLEIDDSPDTDILSHLPICVAWISEALGKLQAAKQARQAGIKPVPMAREKVLAASGLPETKEGGVLVHCQAGMSRSATVVAAYLIKALQLDPMEAVEMIREKRPVVEPSETFWYQLGLFYNADGKVSLRDRSTRQFYMERTTSQFMNGNGTAPKTDKMAKFPPTPTASQPPTPAGTHGRRKIRCKMCRRQLAVREHMMDHILDQSPVSRPRTPSVGAHRSPRTSFSFTDSREPSRKPSISGLADVINPLTGLPAPRSRHGSMSTGAPSPMSPLQETDASASGGLARKNSLPSPRRKSSLSSMTAAAAARDVSLSAGANPPSPFPRAGDPGLRFSQSAATTTSSGSGSSGKDSLPSPSNGQVLASQVVPSPQPLSRQGSAAASPTSEFPLHSSTSALPSGSGRSFQSPDQLNARLPPHLLALRAAASSQGSGGLSSPIGTSPSSSPERERDLPAGAFHPNYNRHSLSAHSDEHGGGGAKAAARRMSLLAFTPTEGTPGDRPRKDSFGLGSSAGGASSGSSGSGSGQGPGAGERTRRPSQIGYGGEIATSGPPILVNPKCSGYFVEPLTWMEPFLSKGDISGKITCPNEKCGAKIGNYDWAGVQCGCREWVTPGFCIARNKVDEVW